MINERASEGVTPENNAAVLLWQAVGPKHLSPELRPQLAAQLGIEPLPEDGRYLVDFETFLDKLPSHEVGDNDNHFEQYHQAIRQPWRAEDLPMVDRWLQENKQATDTLVAASHRTHYYSPYLYAGEPAILNTPTAVVRRSHFLGVSAHVPVH